MIPFIPNTSMRTAGKLTKFRDLPSPVDAEEVKSSFVSSRIIEFLRRVKKTKKLIEIYIFVGIFHSKFRFIWLANDLCVETLKRCTQRHRV